MRPRRAVIFDLDGTLVDSSALHRRCLRRACVALGRPEPSAAALAAAQRATDLATIAELVGLADAEAGLAAYHRALLAELGSTSVRPMPAAVDVSRLLLRVGFAVGVCTGRSRAGARALLAAAGLAVPLLVAREDAAVPKPAPDGLLLAVARAGGTAATAVYVGDTPDDARQGQAAGVPSVLVGRRATAYGRVVDGLGGLPHLLAVGKEPDEPVRRHS